MLRGYVETDRVRVDGVTRFVQATDPEGRAVVLKSAVGEQGHRLRVEHAILEDLRAVPGVARALGLEVHGSETALVLERFEGVDLRRRLDDGPLTPAEAVELTARLARILADVHRAGVVHRDIKPANIMRAPDGAVQLIDFGLSTSPSRGRGKGFVGTLAYMAPEQTGRMHCDTDGRADLYALGVTLFEMLTGRLPFERSRPLDYIQAHLAALPARVDALEPTLPPILADIVARLLEKDRALRYQTGDGLAADLEAVHAALAAGQAPTAFPLGRRDGQRRLPPGRMVGREDVVARLERFALADGAGPRWALLVGQAGIGKSSVIGAVRSAVVRAGGIFLEGKFEQYRTGQPYAAFSQALDHLADQILGAPAEALEAWAAALAGLGSLASVVVDLAPRFGAVMADALRGLPSVEDAPPDAVRNRVLLALERLIRIATERADGPVVLVLDDLQRADAGSLWLLGRLLETRAPLVVLSAARPADPPPWRALSRARSAAGRPPLVQRIEPLTDTDILELVAELTGRSLTEAQALGRLTADRSGNNPLLARQFLTFLADSGRLTPHPDGGFGWALDRVMAAGLPADLAETLAARLHGLAPEARDVLSAAACVGAAFEPGLVLELSGLPRRVFDVVLHDLQRQGLLAADARTWRFAHDRIQEAAHGLLAEEARRALHRRIGRHLLETVGAGTLEGEVFTIVDHLNQGGRPEDPEGLARLNLLAGKRALARGAWQAGRAYLGRGLSLIEGSTADRLRRLRFDLTLEAAQAAFLVGDQDDADARFQRLLADTRDPVDRLQLVFRRVVLLTARDRMHEALDIGLAALADHGIDLPRSPNALQRLMALRRARRATTAERARAWLDLAPVEDPASSILLRLMPALAGAAYAVDKGLLVTLLSRTVTEMTTRGRSAWAGISLSTFSLVLLGTGRVEQGLALVEVAREIGATLPPGPSARMAYVVWLFARPWVERFADCVEPMRAHAARAMEAGDIEYVILLLTGMHVLQFFGGEDLERLADDIADSGRRLEPFSTGSRLVVQQQMRRCVGLLDGSEPLDLRELALGAVPGDRPNIMERRLVFALPVLCVFGEFDLALRAAARIMGPRRYFGLAFGPLFDFYRALAGLCDGPTRSRRRLARRVRGRLRALSARNPVEFEPYRRLLDAELIRAGRRAATTALAAYHRAAESARRSDNRLLLGLIEERWAGLYGALGLTVERALHLDEARAVYGAWGAAAKVEALGPPTPRALRARPATIEALPALSSLTSTSSLVDVGDRLDMDTVWTVARALSGDLHLDAVIRVVLDAALHNTGATAGVLALVEGEARLRAVARRAVDGEHTPLDAPLDAIPGVPHGLLRVVARTGESVVLHRADAGRFDDPALAERPHLSVLCVPLSTRDGGVGVLYLENDRTGGAFTGERVRLLELIGMQAAISLANARLHEDTERLAQTLEQRVDARTAELAVARDLALEATRAKSAFLAAMSHEIRTPMNGLLGTAQLLAETALDARQKTYVDIIGGSADSLLRVLNDILDFSKIEAGRFEISPRPFDLSETIDAAVGTVSGLAVRKGLTLAVHVDEALPGAVVGDGTRLRQVLLNLLGNGIKFTPVGGVEVRVGPADGDRVRFEVRDTGIGIGPDQLDRLFEPFAQADGSISRRFGGTGLGLAISRRLVELMGGDIGVSSEPDRGSVFWFELPLPPHTGPSDSVERVAPPAEHEAPLERRPTRVLVVEDNPVNQKITRWMLERQGYGCDVVDNGLAALDAEAEATYDLILMDCQMPELDGLEATRRLRARGCRLPIIALTAGALDDERAACLDAGMDDFVAKPIKLPVLARTVERHLHRDAEAPLAPAAPDPRPPPPT